MFYLKHRILSLSSLVFHVLISGAQSAIFYGNYQSAPPSYSTIFPSFLNQTTNLLPSVHQNQYLRKNPDIVFPENHGFVSNSVPLPGGLPTVPRNQIQWNNPQSIVPPVHGFVSNGVPLPGGLVTVPRNQYQWNNPQSIVPPVHGFVSNGVLLPGGLPTVPQTSETKPFYFSGALRSSTSLINSFPQVPTAQSAMKLSNVNSLNQGSIQYATIPGESPDKAGSLVNAFNIPKATDLFPKTEAQTSSFHSAMPWTTATQAGRGYSEEAYTMSEPVMPYARNPFPFTDLEVTVNTTSNKDNDKPVKERKKGETKRN